ncbi:pantothenate kinase [Fischerella thermalis]|jgi:type III pantothenate kinase|uniref:Type III pantothenate kinase n=2 Tax=Fischerella TaxID=1190 RepID=G6FVH6_9CYAN|nr:pantothenate kinase [Fischerella thermalis]EHC12231.1 putative transcriptional acitvator, Baf family [Fischerella thermalis JSC-11]MBF1990169.1 pantothenate kinase [Fischerella thermalis M58_A2018_009]MBF2062742.1 pantothenate kinase [Fischerella thermalis M66_A2018_004]MBF2070350.1 pantothenate kinase [Fischerella thermalis M48_A2018_028]PLZ86305.1 type III pantothenate kinase [Fischerella thermalis CCMEE 5194]
MWLALIIGNSRLHWGLFDGKTLCHTYDTERLSKSFVYYLSKCQRLSEVQEILSSSPHTPRQSLFVGNQQDRADSPTTPSFPLLLASVVPSQTALWLTYPNVRVVTLEDIPLQGMYPTLGIDRALALWGAGKTWGFPMLVIDAGTALTFTGADANQNLFGGAILPGLGLQMATLAENTGQLPNVELPHDLPQRFAVNTQQAIQSGVIYTLLAGIKDFVEAWWQSFPQGKIAITGGDRTLLAKYLQSLFPEIAKRLIVEPNLIFWGMEKTQNAQFFHNS